MSILAIARRNWALRLSVVLNVCVLLYVCANIGSSGPWIEEPPTNWAAPLQSETFGAIELVNGTQKGAASSAAASAASVGAVKDAAAPRTSGAAAAPGSLRSKLLVTTTPNGAKVETLDKSEHSHNQTVLSLSLSLALTLSLLVSLFPPSSFLSFIFPLILAP